jgi:hypothetical protein
MTSGSRRIIGGLAVAIEIDESTPHAFHRARGVLAFHFQPLRAIALSATTIEVWFRTTEPGGTWMLYALPATIIEAKVIVLRVSRRYRNREFEIRELKRETDKDIG